MASGQRRSPCTTPILVPRGRAAAVEAQRDAEVLRWIGRFRFVTDELLAERFGVSRQQMNLRVRRLTAAGFLQRTDARTQPRLTMLTRKGARAVGLPPRRAPRTDQQREHELAIAWLVSELERAGGVRVRTERECRTLEAEGAGRYSVDVVRSDRPPERRWPDIVLDGGGRRSALELEFSAKGKTRLQAIVDAYAVAPWFDEVVFLTPNISIASRLSRAVSTQSGWSQPPTFRGTRCAGSTGARSHTTHDREATFARCAAEAGTSGDRTMAARRSGARDWGSRRSTRPGCRRRGDTTPVGRRSTFLFPRPRAADRSLRPGATGIGSPAELCPNFVPQPSEPTRSNQQYPYNQGAS